MAWTDSAAGLGSRLGISRRYPGSYRTAIVWRTHPGSKTPNRDGQILRPRPPNFQGEREGLRRRRSISQPRVARNELPWVLDQNAANSEGVEDVCATREIDLPRRPSSTLFGVGRVLGNHFSLPKVASQAWQPWADSFIAFGIFPNRAHSQFGMCSKIRTSPQTTATTISRQKIRNL